MRKKIEISVFVVTSMKYGIAVHGGAGSPASLSDGPAKAVDVGFGLLAGGGLAIDAVTRAVVYMEDDERFNAGTGSVLRFDGIAYLDASVMTSNGECGAVAHLTSTKNPVLVAREVLSTPHILLVADGAKDFARSKGFGEYDNSTEKTKERLRRGLDEYRNGKRPAWPRNWNSQTLDTVGSVAMDSDGNFAAANSTGGTFPALNGRVGDVPLIGCGIFAGPKGAVAATGIGEEIIRKVLAKTVYDSIEDGVHPQQAVEKGVGLYDKSVSIGIIAISEDGIGEASTGEMAHHLKSL
ncbi:MAG: isoaspartyl peptidase/L-asparaginase [Thermoplasmata archaeon]|nr:isoaspartyl peptidase/L-asparaginase [Candidatus Sysuiplasma acidicola]MBX8646652.1 isoaspartyl peptidase/L-asparaginase [Candidatus Sysuiplasma acidicola]MDH2905913.1 isoaspartyl peptidase/L-asparaginase [Methanomassiliicoccales archaeon]